MKFNKKKVFVVSLAVSLIAILSLGTLAWFNAKDEVTNRFKIAVSDQEGTPDFSVDVWENDSTGQADTDGVEYENILPGDVIPKNPTVANTGFYEQWIRVYVTFDEYSIIEAACERNGITADLRGWLNVDETLWSKSDAECKRNGHTMTYVYYYNNKLAKDAEAELFTKVTIPYQFEQEDMTYEDGDFSISVKAEAVQASNTGTSAKDAFDYVGWEAGTEYDQ